jgi:hypothetical protein
MQQPPAAVAAAAAAVWLFSHVCSVLHLHSASALLLDMLCWMPASASSRNFHESVLRRSEAHHRYKPLLGR